MHISSLPSDYGIGTMGKEAYKFVDFKECKTKVLADSSDWPGQVTAIRRISRSQRMQGNCIL